MSVAEVVSMVMAELLVVMLKALGRRGRTYDNPKTKIEENLYRIGDDSRHVDQGSSCRSWSRCSSKLRG